jgi:hypothetical protein
MEAAARSERGRPWPKLAAEGGEGEEGSRGGCARLSLELHSHSGAVGGNGGEEEDEQC